MIAPMDSSSSSSSELAQRLYRKNTELENELRKSAQAKIPSDPNIWLQMRENYEAIILEDPDFSERHSIESTLWQLHYRRIEEFRSHINSASATRESASNPGGKSLARPDRLKKIRSAFKSFLSEATGFYHDLIQKIRAKYGLPLGYFPENSEGRVNFEKDEKRSAEVKKALTSCHRCLIYLGDLSRYKGLYGEGDAVNRDFAASAAYYTQAASLSPSSGNPHHQLAILASYHNDDLVAIYRYFRSLSVDNPFPTARENLIIAFEKNRQRYSQLSQNVKSTPLKSATQMNGRGRGRGREVKVVAADTKMESMSKKEQLSIAEIFKSFSIRFLRLNGILFTRTSLETFGELSQSVFSDLTELLASGPEEELNFGSSPTENGLVIVWLIAILIFTVHNVKRESETQSYAEILQRSLLLQHAFTVAFEFAGHIVKRCLQLRNASSSYLVPGILVFIEWLACHPDIASGVEGDEKLVAPRSFFWNQFVAFANKVLFSGLVPIDSDGDETCFSQMARYDDGESSSSLALWEDFELRGFSPLAPAQLILDFSSQHAPHGGLKEEKVRMQRIITAGKILMNIVKVDHQAIYFDSRSRRFVIGKEPLTFENDGEVSFPGIPNALKNESAVENPVDFANIQPKFHGVGKDIEEEEEEIVFKPTIAEKYQNTSISSAFEAKPLVQIPASNLINYVDSASASQSIPSQTVPEAYSHAYMATNMSRQPIQDGILSTSKWVASQGEFLSNGLHSMMIAEQGQSTDIGSYGALNTFQSTADMSLFTTPPSSSTGTILPGLVPVFDAIIPSKLDSILPSGTDLDGVGVRPGSVAPVSTRKKPVSRPVRHLGPPPGFSHVLSKQSEDLPLKDEFVDDYSWLDGYKAPTTKSLMNGIPTSKLSQIFSEPVLNNNTFVSTMDFQLSGKHVPELYSEISSNNGWRDHQALDNWKLYPEKERYQAQWPSRYFVQNP